MIKKLIYFLITICFISFTAYKVFEKEPEFVVEDYYGYSKYDFADEANSSVDGSILKNPDYALQDNQIKHIMEKATDSIICSPVQQKINYTLCHYPSDSHSVIARKYGYNEDEAAKFAALLTRIPHAGIIDIGANIGTISLPIMVQLNGTRPFLMVEPNPNNIAPLLLGIYKNKMENSRWAIIPRAMWNVSDLTVNLVQWEISSNGHLELLNDNPRIHNLPNGHHNFKQLPVKTATIDGQILPVAKAMGITAAILKMDIEGSECVALSKAENLLSQIYIPYIYMEYWPAYKMQDDWHCVYRMVKTLADFGYRPFRGNSSWTANDKLELKLYKRWTDFDIFWKKML